jgi:hypothetical protein
MTKKMERAKEQLVNELGKIDPEQKAKQISSLFENHPDHPPNADEGRKHWYYCSYPLFIEHAQQIKRALEGCNGGDASFEKDVTQMVAFVMSWIGHIPTARIKDKDNLNTLCKYIKEFASKDASVSDRGIIDFDLQYNSFADAVNSVKGYCNSVNILIYGQRQTKKKRDNIPTVSKFLHFLHPALFPILDKNINDKVFQASSSPDMKAYLNYIEALKNALKEEQTATTIEQFQKHLAGHGMNVSKIRAIDMALF